MKSIFAITLVTLYGLSMRLLFVSSNGLTEVMSMAFIFILPMVIGYLTIILPSKNVQSTSGAFCLPWLTCFVILIITMMFNIEGAICWVMIFPIFGILSGIGGVIAYNRREKNEEKRDDDDDILDSPNSLRVSIIILLPLVLGLLEGKRTQSRSDLDISHEIVIAAPASKVWQSLLNIKAIEHHETRWSFSTLIGFPNHLETTLDTLKIGGIRTAQYEKGLRFDEIITQFEPEKRLVLDINTDPSKIPPTVMDEHIVIGGKHLDILEDIYTLQALPDGKTRLTLSSHFFISTPFNWYAGLWANYLMNDILENELKIIEKRAIK
jgi:uncharacterized protein YndB with AHSA1/START domain